MSKDDILNLSDLNGYARLYQTLLNDGFTPARLKRLMYDWYIANIKAYNERYGASIRFVSPEAFANHMETAQACAYKTEVQLMKALNLIAWNVSYTPSFELSNHVLTDISRDCADAFRMECFCAINDRITTYSLCENTLNPGHEPESEFNPAAMLRLENKKPHLMYICAPLRGDVQKNIQFARRKAKEVFADGDIPVCPHLMFTPIADPENPEQDKRALDMCLKLIERCDRVHVYGPEHTEGMRQEIRHAERLGIPVHTEQMERRKTKSRKNSGPCR